MNNQNLELILTNAKCCSSKLASEVSYMYSIGNNCSKSEFNKLKLLQDRMDALCRYKSTYLTNIVKNGTFNNNTSFWTINNPGNWIYSTILDGSIIYKGADEGGTFSQDILTLNENYIISFDIIFNNLGNSENCNLVINFGSNSYPITLSSSTSIQHISFPATCIGNTVLSFYTISFPSPSSLYYIDNIVINKASEVLKTCLTEEKMNLMAHDIMKQCDICDCQLTIE